MDTDGWNPLIRRLDSIVSALAVLVSEMTTSQASLFQKRVNTLSISCRAFADEESAVEWLKSLDVGER